MGGLPIMCARKIQSLWQCPRCGRPFANRNQSHSCGKYTVRAHLSGKSPHARALYRNWVELVETCGPVKIVPAKTRIGFQVRMIFAAVNKIGDVCLDAHLVLARRIEHPRFRRVESLGPRSYVHHLRLCRSEDFDNLLRDWLCEAYGVGERKHLKQA
jgi:Domain of unknown function (DUF5655)